MKLTLNLNLCNISNLTSLSIIFISRRQPPSLPFATATATLTHTTKYQLAYGKFFVELAIASEIRERVTGDARDAILDDIQEQVFILNSTFSWKESDRAAAKCATHALADLAKNEEVVNMIVEGGAILALVQHLQAPPVTEEDLVQKLLPFEHEVEKGSAFALGLLAVKKEAETHLLELEARDGITITMEDIGTSRVWNMRYSFHPFCLAHPETDEVYAQMTLQPVLSFAINLESDCKEKRLEPMGIEFFN
ncbi:ARM REPEAT PROTEIN INTERACTING WITH [Arachis hypogaea]|nr:ARM REPEAT PROTEIN INTERACTING WITH [Arachis hypogaea]